MGEAFVWVAVLVWDVLVAAGECIEKGVVGCVFDYLPSALRNALDAMNAGAQAVVDAVSGIFIALMTICAAIASGIDFSEEGCTFGLSMSWPEFYWEWSVTEFKWLPEVRWHETYICVVPGYDASKPLAAMSESTILEDLKQSTIFAEMFNMGGAGDAALVQLKEDGTHMTNTEMLEGEDGPCQQGFAGSIVAGVSVDLSYCCGALGLSFGVELAIGCDAHGSMISQFQLAFGAAISYPPDGFDFFKICFGWYAGAIDPNTAIQMAVTTSGYMSWVGVATAGFQISGFLEWIEGKIEFKGVGLEFSVSDIMSWFDTADPASILPSGLAQLEAGHNSTVSTAVRRFTGSAGFGGSIGIPMVVIFENGNWCSRWVIAGSSGL